MSVYQKWVAGELVEYTRDGVDQLDPSAVEKGRNALLAVGRVAKAACYGKKVRVSDEEQARRMAICATCEFFTGKTCLKCGCNARWKAKLSTEKCPVGKW